MVRSDVLRANYGSNPWQEKNQVVTSISWVSRVEDAKESLLRSRWDLTVVDEAHKMSAASSDKRMLAYDLGEQLSELTDHYLLMTATPHKGDPENFRLFLQLLDRDVYGTVQASTRPYASTRRRSTCAASKRRWSIIPTRRRAPSETLHQTKSGNHRLRDRRRRVGSLRRTDALCGRPVDQSCGRGLPSALTRSYPLVLTRTDPCEEQALPAGKG